MFSVFAVNISTGRGAQRPAEQGGHVQTIIATRGTKTRVIKLSLDLILKEPFGLAECSFLSHDDMSVVVVK